MIDMENQEDKREQVTESATTESLSSPRVVGTGLRHRKSEDFDKSNSIFSKGSKRTYRRKSKWKKAQAEPLSNVQENTFLNMYLRKTNRALTGTKRRNTTYEFVFLFIFLVLVYSAGSYSRDYSNYDVDSETFVSLTFQQVILIGVWIFLAVVVTSVFKESRFIELLYWMIIYLPLMGFVCLFLFTSDIANTATWIIWGITEGVALCSFLVIYFMYPKMINSVWFRKKSRVSAYFRIHLVDDWTMTYLRRKARFYLGTRQTCKYDGEVNEKGEPHGLGRWIDDAYDGEILTGTWKNGVPVAPFVSKTSGTGDALRAVRVAYIKASDDDFTATKWMPTDDLPAECGIASVECSVAGAFYNELPLAQDIIERSLFNTETSIAEVCDQLTHLVDQEPAGNSLHINADDPRGIHIDGHVYAVTGKPFQSVDHISITVRKESQTEAQKIRPKLTYMPISRRSLDGESIRIREDIDDTEAETAAALPDLKEKKADDGMVEMEEGKKHFNQKFQLEIQDWVPCKKRDALIFFPGFNCSLKNALENLGQLLAMTKLDIHVHPILFNWPAGQVLTYFQASRASHTDRNYHNVAQVMKGLKHAGIRNIHLMSHSMGVQSMLGAFVDKKHGSRSEASLCFQLASDCDEDEIGQDKPQKIDEDEIDEYESIDEGDLLICKTITMLNPDFPLKPFQDHAYRSIRRLCRCITIVGDRNDQALFYSMAVNGVAVRCGYKQPHAMLPNDRNKKSLRYLPVIGKRIDDLYFPDEVVKKDDILKHDYLLFKERAPLVLLPEDEQDTEKAWMDLDVIDTTGLDTNIANIRHSAYNLNPSLLRDLEELVSTSKRARNRSLLYREGNLYSYCSAPAYVAM